MLAMFHPWQDLALGGCVALELIGDDHARDVGQPLEQLTEELLRGPLVPATLHHDIQHVAVLIYRPPEIVVFALDGEKQSSSAGEFNPYALTELDVNLSIHPALIVQPLTERTANGQTTLAVG